MFSRHGLASLRVRLEILRGELDVRGEDDDSVLQVRVPVDAVPIAKFEPTLVDAVERDFGARSRRRSRLAWLAPVALALLAAAFAVGYFVYVTVASVLPPETFARLEVGMEQRTAEGLLPATEMLDAPRDELPEPPDSTCAYFESALSFFERDDVYRVCFTDGTVSDLRIVPSP